MLKFHQLRTWFSMWWVLACVSVVSAAHNDWAEGAPGKSDGASRDYYNRAALLSWDNFMGDWRDAKDVAQGNAAYATTTVVDDDSGKFVEWDVTGLIREWLAGKHQNQGMFLRGTEGRGTYVFCSREHAESPHRPRLIAIGDKGSQTLAPKADTYLEQSTYRSQGNSELLRVSDNPNHALLRFDLDDLAECGNVTRATLRLYTYAQYGSASMDIGVFRCAQGHDQPDAEPIQGLAAGYLGDTGIQRDPNVIFFSDFESDEWIEGWTSVAHLQALETLDADSDRDFEPVQGKALRVRIAEGSTGALNMTYKFKRETGEEPNEVFSRYYLRLADDWNQALQGGKLPGISGTYGVAGWGGRKSDGTDGWSARGSFHLTIPRENPLGGLTPIGTYCYHADMKGQYGNVWLWQNGYRGFLKNNRWYCVEQYLKLNTPGEKDGIIRAWIDGRPAFEKTDIRFRHTDRLKIEQVWMNVYHGGKKPSPYDQHLYIDNVVIAREYIGPMK